MTILRISQSTVRKNSYRVEVTLEGDGLPRQTAVSKFSFKMSHEDNEDLRWYLEEYLQYPFDPAPLIAGRIERRMADIGTELFRAVFQKNKRTLGELDAARVAHAANTVCEALSKTAPDTPSDER